MARMRKTGLGGGLGARYGTAPRKRYIEILTRMRRFHECPRCQIRATRRLSVGLWQCRRCGHQFTGGAYTPSTKVGNVAERSAIGALYSPITAKTTAELAGSETADLATGKPKKKPRRKRTTPNETEKKETETELAA